MTSDKDPDPGQVADAAVAMWNEVNTSLVPIIGSRGVAGLYQRSLSLTRARHPCLSIVHETSRQPGEFTALHRALAQQTGPVASAARNALQQTFFALLASLIGESLSTQLLRSVRGSVSSGQAAQDTSG